ncbi:MAG: hypothetical protein JW934_22400 [Anaerolineae bacterium]|nr:hypothetical protein [Anaerolineae bacterium]
MEATIHIGHRLIWKASDTTPGEVDAEADRLRAAGDVPIVHVTLTGSEHRAINQAVRERDGRRCRKCGSRVDVQIANMIYDEWHNPDRMVLLCRPCRRARPPTFGDTPGFGGWTPEQCWEWVLNGQSGLDERADRFLSDPQIARAVTASSARKEEFREMIQRWLLESDFGLHPETDWSQHGLSPYAEAALREFFHGQTEPMPDAMAGFIASLDMSGLSCNQGLPARAAIYHWVDLQAGETMREALGALDVLVARSPSKETPIFFDILGAPNQEQFETANEELQEHCRKRGYNLVRLPG